MASLTRPAAAETVIRAGFGLYYDDLAQNGWATAFQGVNNSNYAMGPCSFSGGAFSGAGCLTGGAGATGNLIGSPYKTPYSVHTTGGVQHAFNERWLASADYVHEQGNHGYRGFPYSGGTNLFTPFYPTTDVNDQTAVVPNVNVFESDNRSSYNGLMLHLQGNMRRFNLVANYTLSKAQTWGCLLGELFDYVDGVCPDEPGTPNAGLLNAFGPGDYGPSGEDVRHRFVFAGTVRIPGGFELSTINQVESARPITITNLNNTDRIYVQFNGGSCPYQPRRIPGHALHSVRSARHASFQDQRALAGCSLHRVLQPLQPNNPGANFAVNVAQLPVPSGR